MPILITILSVYAVCWLWDTLNAPERRRLKEEGDKRRKDMGY